MYQEAKNESHKSQQLKMTSQAKENIREIYQWLLECYAAQKLEIGILQ